MSKYRWHILLLMAVAIFIYLLFSCQGVLSLYKWEICEDIKLADNVTLVGKPNTIKKGDITVEVYINNYTEYTVSCYYGGAVLDKLEKNAWMRWLPRTSLPSLAIPPTAVILGPGEGSIVKLMLPLLLPNELWEPGQYRLRMWVSYEGIGLSDTLFSPNIEYYSWALLTLY